jgi:tRNA threonylcarbamoyladenosine biosynthesis protein TsaE
MMRTGLALVTASPEETRALGRTLAAFLRPRDVISLTGDLGAGKTTFVQGVASGLEVTEPVLSPTFTLVRRYRGTLPVYHLDVYRLERLQEALDIGLDEILDQGAVIFIEWGDAIDPLLPPEHLQVEITLPAVGDRRQLQLTWFGRTWAERIDRLAQVLELWRA